MPWVSIIDSTHGQLRQRDLKLVPRGEGFASDFLYAHCAPFSLAGRFSARRTSQLTTPKAKSELGTRETTVSSFSDRFPPIAGSSHH